MKRRKKEKKEKKKNREPKKSTGRGGALTNSEQDNIREKEK
jgi:hypothetical protein